MSGGDDGRVVWSRPDETQVLAEAGPSRWIDCLAVTAHQGLYAFGCGREAHVRDLADASFERVFVHERSVADLAFDPRARRLAAATYGGAALWYARIADQKPVMLRWAGSHIAVAFSPDGRFLMSSMQENALHGWRLSDARDMRMGGYPAKVKQPGLPRWRADAGHLGREWRGGLALRRQRRSDGQAGHGDRLRPGRPCRPRGGQADGSAIAAGLDDGRVWVADVTGGRREDIKAEKGPPITALAMAHGRIAWGDEEGGAGVASVPELR